MKIVAMLKYIQLLQKSRIMPFSFISSLQIVHHPVFLALSKFYPKEEQFFKKYMSVCFFQAIQRFEYKMFNQWCTIESDPGVFTQLVKSMGAPTVQVEQIYSLDDDELINRVQPHIYGFIFLFKWTKNIEKKDYLTEYDQDLFFARQVVNNACATQAILSVLLNAPISIQSHIKHFHDFAKELSAEDRGLVLSNSQPIRQLHNSFSRPEPFIFKQDKRKKKKQADVYHFVSYVPHKGSLYELDGLQPGPILIGKYQNPADWIQLAKQQIQSRIQKCGHEIRFNLLVVCEDLKLKNQRQIELLKSQKAGIAKSLRNLGEAYDATIIDQYPDAEASSETDVSKLVMRNEQIHMIIQEKEAYCQSEDIRRQQRREENIRRKHNYIPLIVQVLKTLAKKKKLPQLIEKATKKQ